MYPTIERVADERRKTALPDMLSVQVRVILALSIQRMDQYILPLPAEWRLPRAVEELVPPLMQLHTLSI